MSTSRVDPDQLTGEAARQAMGENPFGYRALTEAEHQQVTESAQFKRYTTDVVRGR